MCNYRLQTKFAKVMFLHVSVSHSVHGGGVGMCGWEACMARESAWPGGVHARGACMARGHVWPGCVCVPGGMHAQGACVPGGHA